MQTENLEQPIVETHTVDGLDHVVDDMVIDTDDFDIFASLDDLKVEEKEEPQVNVEVKEEDEVDAELAEDDEDEDFDFDDIDDEDGEAEEETSEEDSEEDIEESDEDEGNDIEELEDEEVDYEGYEVTLPNGEVVKLDEAVQGYRNAEALAEERKAFEEEREAFNVSSEGINKTLDLAKLEADRAIEDYTDFDWAELSRNDPQSYVEHREFLDRYIERRKEIVREMELRTENKEAEQKANLQSRARACVQELQQAIPNWSEKVYNELIEFAVENGADRSEVLQDVNPVSFKMLYKALQFEKGSRVVKAKVKKAVKSPKRVAKSAASKPGNAKAPSKKAIIAKKAELGDFSNAFDFLED